MTFSDALTLGAILGVVVIVAIGIWWERWKP